MQRQVAGLYAEAINKLNREGVRRGLNQADIDEINQLSFEQMLTQYGDTLNELSPGLVDQIDELIVKVRDLDSEIAKGSTVDTSGIVKVAFADEIQSDIMQAAATAIAAIASAALGRAMLVFECGARVRAGMCACVHSCV